MGQVMNEPVKSASERRGRSGYTKAALVMCPVLGVATTAWLLIGTRPSASDAPLVVSELRGPVAVVKVVPAANAPPHAVEAAMPDEADERHRAAIIGRWWRDEYYGRTFLDLKADGTGTMVIQFESWYYYALGARLDADITWKIENGRAIFDSLRGRPEAAFRTVTEKKGSHRDRKLIEIGDERMTFKDDLDDQSISTWQRAE